MKPCLFCQNEFQEDNIFENKSFYLKIDQFPVAPGHLLIIPKRHMPTFFELTQDEFADLQIMIAKAKELAHGELVQQFYQKVVSQLDNNPKAAAWCQWALDHWDKEISGYNIGVNNGVSAGQTIFHLHIHLIPRFLGDVSDPTGGVRFVIPERANYR